MQGCLRGIRTSRNVSDSHCSRHFRRFDPENFETVAYPRNEELVWVGGRWWWFPGARISADSKFKWRDHRVCLLEPDGTAIEGILFVGEVATG